MGRQARSGYIGVVIHRDLSLAILAAGLLAAVSMPTAAAWGVAACHQGEAARVWTAPLRPVAGEPLRVLAVATDDVLDEVRVTGPDGRPIRLPTSPGGGPPWNLLGTLPEPGQGTHRIEALREGRVLACTETPVGAGAGDRGSGHWDLAAQAFYSAWVERLFDAPPDEALGFPALAPVLGDPARNFLHGYLGAGEDEGLPAEPDCADLSYFMRAYFAWKLGLPIAYRACSRGTRDSPPRCEGPTIERAFAGALASAATFRGVSRRIMDTITSGSGRAAFRDEATDVYPVPLDRGSLWPGTLYADPYGHTLILVKWVPQTAERSGLLLAVDAQPDNSISRKRFWEGTFLFAQTPSAGPGFKAHRPLVAGPGGLRLLPNGALDGRDGTPRYSEEQAGLSPADFYARMERLINPHGLDPEGAYEAALAALVEQLETRVRSVENGEAYVRAHPGATIPMPSGPAIFETTGPWEDYSTPSRDMRLLIAMKVVAGLPERIRRYPELFVLRGEDPDAAATRIERLHARRTQDTSIGYTGSDGSPWRLSLAELYARRGALEVAYNPNDCVERRWGAPPGAEDFATCRRHAPAEQRARMEEYRAWFREARRPPR
jgi:hypothetical protein